MNFISCLNVNYMKKRETYIFKKNTTGQDQMFLNTVSDRL